MIYYEGYEAEKFNKFSLDTGVLSLANFFTVLCISPIAYRKKHPTEAKIEIDKKDDEMIISITNDYGNGVYVIRITGESMSDPVLLAALEEYEKKTLEIE